MLASLVVLSLLWPVHGTADSVGAWMAPGVSRALAAYRSTQISNVRYDLSLDVTARDSASGHVTVRFRRARAGDAILDWRGPHLGAARANGRPIRGLVANGAHVSVPAAALRPGENVLDFDFAAAIAPAGASIIRFHDSADDAEYLYTLLVPADANALFPCFDQPDLKARVSFTLIAPRAWSVVANGALADARDSGAVRRHRFRETEPISTYLIAFAAGPWARVTSAAGTRPITMYVRASRAKEAEADSLIALNDRAAGWLERYFDRPFPFRKLDFVLAPAFPFGGMEHPGAIFYNEEQFIFRERATMSQRLGREATIFHEVAHQWFGDLVTMRWFDDLWLKEGFATYMAAKMQNALDPASHAWKSFYLRNKPAAYGVDAGEGTTPVWQSLANLDQAKSNYGAIVYNKAPSVLKQLEYVVGDSAFRDGLRAFLQQHAYANATWSDLLRAVGTAAGRPLDDWGRQYILRPGMPVIEQALVTAGDVPCASGQGPLPVCREVTTAADAAHGIQLTQRPARPLSGPAPWPIRTEVLFAYEGAPPKRVAISLDAATTVVPFPAGDAKPAFVFANAGDYAYALTLLDPRSTEWLERHVGEIDDPLLRAMLWGSLWDLVRDAKLAPSRYLAMMLRELPRERDEQLTGSIIAHAARVANNYLSDDAAVPALEEALARGASDNARPYGIRKAHLDALIGVATTPDMLARLDAALDSTSLLGLPLGAPTRWSIVTTLVERATGGGEARLAAEARRDSTSEGKRRAFAAGAGRPSTENKRRYFTRYFGDSTLNEDWVTASLRAFNAPHQSALALPYIAPTLDTLPWIQRNRRIFFLGSWLGAFLEGQTDPRALSVVREFLTAHPALALDLRQKILQSADELERTVRIRRAFAGPPAAATVPQ